MGTCFKNVYSSDMAMQYALAARGWQIEPWNESAQMVNGTPGPKEAAFWHYCSCYRGIKPPYRMSLHADGAKLVKPPPSKYHDLASTCQLCYNKSRYTELWGSAECTNRFPFRYSDILME